MHFYYISEIISFQIILYVILCNTFNGRLNKLIVICPVVVLVLISLLEMSNYNDILYFFSDILFYFVLPTLTVKNIKKKKILGLSIVIVGVFSLINITVLFINTFFSNNLAVTSVFNIFIDIVFLITVVFLSTNQKFTETITYLSSLSKRVKVISILFIWELVILISILTVCLLQYPDLPAISITSFLIILIVIISFGAFYLLITNNLKRLHYEKINKTIQNNMNEQVRYYEQLSRSNNDLKKFRHDTNNIKIGLTTYLTNRDIDGAIDYLNSLEIMVTDSPVIFHTGHKIIDALLSDKVKDAKASDTKILFNGLIPSDILTPVDLCIILGNAIDNSIEACHKIHNTENKTISISAVQRQDYMFITITNPVMEDVKINNNTILSTKKDKESHGIGLYSIKQVLKKYNGHIKLSCENQLFKTDIDFQVI